ncbi:hypothetical protein AcW1_010029 [Taiwanofungus camphoratus]|nr:hypothetical protein AcW1_010029 [Antrodia cinnamomea]
MSPDLLAWGPHPARPASLKGFFAPRLLSPSSLAASPLPSSLLPLLPLLPFLLPSSLFPPPSTLTPPHPAQHPQSQ